MISILLIKFRLLGLDILCRWTLVTLCCCMNIILTCFLPVIAQPWRHDRLSPTDWFSSGVAKMLREEIDASEWNVGKSNWDLTMGSWDDTHRLSVWWQAYSSKKKQELHLTKQQQRPNKKYITILNWYISGPVLIVQGKMNSPTVRVKLYLSLKGKFSNSRGGITRSNYQ